MSESAISYVNGTSSEPLMYKTIGAALDDATTAWPNKEGVIVRQQDIRWSFETLNNAANEFAAGLIALGFKPGERIGIWSPNNIEWVITQFATAKAGLVLVNVNPAYRIGELEYALNKVECKGLIIAESFKTSDYVAMINKLAPELADSKPGELQAAKLPHLKTR